jgi:glycosyltransferase involved in cell wall biosynthesis
MEQNIHLDIEPLLSDKYLNYRFGGDTLFPFFNVFFSILKRLLILSRQKKYDCAILYCELFPFLPSFIERKLLSIPYIYDFDDAFYLRYRVKKKIIRSIFLGNKFDVIIANAAAVSAGNIVLEDYAKRYNVKTFVVPTVVDTNNFIAIDNSNKEDFLHIGWIGSPSTAPYLQELVEPLSLLGSKTKVVFTVIGGSSPSIPNVEVNEVQWKESTEVELINTFDIGVMPLPDNDWTRGKCGFKLIEYMSCSVPVIASPVGANCVVVDNECGFLVKTTKDWLNAFCYMLDNPDTRKQMGENGRKRVISEYSLQHCAPIISNIIRKVCR